MSQNFRKEIKNLLKEHKIRPSKRLGQNFLISKRILDRIIKASNLKKNDVVLEIGPGIGTLTQELAKRVKKVIAVEKDKKMIKILHETLRNFTNVEITQGDILKLPVTRYSLPVTAYKIIANLPYYIVSPVIRKFLETKNSPKEMILMVQKEVAQRICSKPPKMNLLAISVQFYAKPETLFLVPKESFWPKPKVDGAVIKISRIRTNLPQINTNSFFRIVKAGFSQPRKQIVNSLSKGLALSLPNGLKLDKEEVKGWLLKNKIKPIQRAETLSVKDWIRLTKNYIIIQ